MTDSLLDTMLKQTDIADVTMEAVRTSEMSVYFNVTTWHYIPEGYHLHTCAMRT
jgi:hypothetical protein